MVTKVLTKAAPKSNLSSKISSDRAIIDKWTEQEKKDFHTLVSKLYIPNLQIDSDLYLPRIPTIDLNNRYALWCANPTAFLCRPSTRNVLSCHSLDRTINPQYFAGNLGYLISPYWGNFWVVKKTSTKRAKFEIIHDGDYPNPLSSVNFMLLEDDKLGKFIVLSNAWYGEYNHEVHSEQLCANAIEDTLGIPVYSVINSYYDNLIIHYKPQIIVNEDAIPERYRDVACPHVAYKNNMIVQETFGITPISKNANVFENPIIINNKLVDNNAVYHRSLCNLGDLGVDMSSIGYVNISLGIDEDTLGVPYI